MAKKEERDCWANLITSNGFLQVGEKPDSSLNLTNFHRKSIEFDSDSDYGWELLHEYMQLDSCGEMLGARNTLFA